MQPVILAFKLSLDDPIHRRRNQESQALDVWTYGFGPPPVDSDFSIDVLTNNLMLLHLHKDVTDKIELYQQ
jgi:hypothetical protein